MKKDIDKNKKNIADESLEEIAGGVGITNNGGVNIDNGSVTTGIGPNGGGTTDTLASANPFADISKDLPGSAGGDNKEEQEDKPKMGLAKMPM
ncbi:hypothetical protein [Francisella salimarina]|uniref:hypothetical protein n=1 Tax=Francisella salimarina TaxID=2599927 RepID=UPI003750DAFC